MIYGGLVSITFRELTASEVILLVKHTNLKGIEWGGDIHVPHGDVEKAIEVGEMTRQAGLKVVAYGSYYRAGNKDNPSFDSVLNTAVALKAPVIRIWAGKKASDSCDNEYRQEVINDIRNCAELCMKKNIELALEYHGNTLTDTNISAMKLLNEISHQNVVCYWQPPNGKSKDYRMEGLKQLKTINKLSHLHVFEWNNINKRQPLAKGSEHWLSYLEQAMQDNKDRFALLEFVEDNDSENFLTDAETLTQWLYIINRR